MLDAIATYVLVAAAALYLLWKLVLPASLRRRPSSRPSGPTGSCGSDVAGGQCPSGCTGCSPGSRHGRS